jgi:hypothetical protein
MGAAPPQNTQRTEIVSLLIIAIQLNLIPKKTNFGSGLKILAVPQKSIPPNFFAFLQLLIWFGLTKN